MAGSSSLSPSSPFSSSSLVVAEEDRPAFLESPQYGRYDEDSDNWDQAADQPYAVATTTFFGQTFFEPEYKLLVAMVSLLEVEKKRRGADNVSFRHHVFAPLVGNGGVLKDTTIAINGMLCRFSARAFAKIAALVPIGYAVTYSDYHLGIPDPCWDVLTRDCLLAMLESVGIVPGHPLPTDADRLVFADVLDGSQFMRRIIQPTAVTDQEPRTIYNFSA